MDQFIDIKGARVNNLKNISLQIPRNQLIVITGLSGSGKSSLAFDTLYAEGQRRYVESLSSYARQFLGRKSKPECDYIKGLPPAIAIEQKVIARNPRSTVGTSTEIYEYLRLLFSRIGKTFSPVSGQEVKKHTVEDVIQCVQQYSQGTKFAIISPVHLIDGRSIEKQLEMFMQEGYTRLWHHDDFLRIDDLLSDEKTLKEIKSNELFLLIDRLSVDSSKENISRLADSVETAFYEGRGECKLVFLPSNITYHFSTRFEVDGIVFEEANDNMFSFNSPLGACQQCEGFGSVIGIDEKLVIPDSTQSVYDGCVQCWHGDKMGIWKDEFCRRAAKNNFPIFKPYFELTKKEKEMLWHGLPSEKNKPIAEQICIDAFFQMVKDNQYKIQYRVMMSRYKGKTTCPSCQGTRLRPEANWVKIDGMSITDLVQMPIVELKEWFDNINLNEHEQHIAKRLLTEINSRLQFLLDVGLGYLTLNRTSNTLSGGESQRINLTTALGSSLVGSLYILDEPSIGLHSIDTQRLIDVLKKLQKLGNTVMIVEHDKDIMNAADTLIDIGPDAGRLGGEVVFNGSIAELPNKKKEFAQQFPQSHTIQYLTGQQCINTPTSRRSWNKAIELVGARENNLKGITVKFPLNVLTVITGVSGSGKSTLVKTILYPAIKRHLDEVADLPGEYIRLDGDWKAIKHVEMVDQNPIGKSSRSNAATYVKAYDGIRQLFAEQPLSKQMGFSPQYFSFNADGGRCEECKGAGVIKVEMQFMADLELECEACHGKRFKNEVLDVRVDGMNINDILNLTVIEAIAFFTSQKQTSIVNKLQPLNDVGLGYIKLGQSSSTLSGGESQRVKLAYFLSQERQEPTLFILDEPTTGLHYVDIQRLLTTFNALIERGHSIIVIEHNVDVIKCADHIIDLGPAGGDRGGMLVAEGTPEEIIINKESLTARFLKDEL